MASHIYVRNKIKACEQVGLRSLKILLEAKTSQEEVFRIIDELNADSSVSGILVQLPLPAHLDALTVALRIDPLKDVDGVHPINLGKLLTGETSGYIPCTPLGIQVLLERSGIDVKGKHVVIAGRSNIVGKPLAVLLMQKRKGADATVTVVHSHSEDLQAIAREADVLVAAIGKAHYFTANMVKEGAVVIDVGQNRLEDPSHPKGYRLVGDVDYEAVSHKCRAITPVPGGVGPMTIAMLLNNTVLAYHRQRIRPS
jgi:methylenetetrahydrofolate dehydrogenase (NADP+)/methenyltetrahydrofolate cyclohydrolase